MATDIEFRYFSGNRGAQANKIIQNVIFGTV